MAYAWFTDPVCGVSEISIIRDSGNRLRVSTANRLSDEQVDDLYWIILAMAKTGKKLGELLLEEKGEEE